MPETRPGRAQVPPRTGFSPALRTGPPTILPPAPSRSGESSGAPHDPLRATLLELLRLLNAAENYDREQEKGLELAEIEFQSTEFWGVRQAGVSVPFALGLLLRNQMIRYVGGGAHSWTRQRNMGPHYRIDLAGKAFLANTIEKDGRLA